MLLVGEVRRGFLVVLLSFTALAALAMAKLGKGEVPLDAILGMAV